MQVSVIRGRDMTHEHISLWAAIQSANPVLESPFFRPEFVMAISQAAENVHVGVLHEPDGKPAGFFPFHLIRPRIGRSLEMCDYQGVIAPSTFQWNATDLLKSCGLKVWEFDHLLPEQEAFRRFHLYTVKSPIMNIMNGYDAYFSSLHDEGKKQLAKLATSTRKVERELGKLRFVPNCEDSEVMEQMHEWRAAKYRILPKWSYDALQTMRKTSAEGFAGILSALYAGDELIAVHFGIRSRTVWHWWFPAYHPQLPSRYAPGMLLLLHMAQYCECLGTNIIDLGKGIQSYKQKFQNDSRAVGTGSVDVLSLSTVPRIIRRTCLNFIRNTPELREFARGAKQIFQKKPPASA